MINLNGGKVPDELCFLSNNSCYFVLPSFFAELCTLDVDCASDLLQYAVVTGRVMGVDFLNLRQLLNLPLIQDTRCRYRIAATAFDDRLLECDRDSPTVDTTPAFSVSVEYRQRHRQRNYG